MKALTALPALIAVLCCSTAHAQLDQLLDAAAGCTPDALEPNSYEAPTPVAADGVRLSANICGDNDVYVMHAGAGHSIEVIVEFSHADGDIDVRLLNEDADVLLVEASATDDERFLWGSSTDQRLYVDVYGYGGAGGDYTITVKRWDFGAECARDLVDGDTTDDAPRLGVHDELTGSLCFDDTDRVRLPDDGRYELRLSAVPEDAFPGAALIDAQGNETPIEADAWPLTLRSNGSAWLQLQYSGEAPGLWHLSSTLLHDGAARSGRVHGTVTYDRLLHPSPEDDSRTVAARAIEVAVVRENGDPVAATTTDAEGRWSIEWVDNSESDLFVQITAESVVGESRTVVVNNEHEWLPHSVRSRALSGRLREERIDAHFTAETPMAGALNIATRCGDAMEAVAAFDDTPLSLRVVWSRGRPHACTSCFDGRDIYLGGGFDDPDEFDDSVILHEFGHFFVSELSRDDSPGGAHSGAPTDPLVAFGEGIATAFALIVNDSARYTDRMAGSGHDQDFEAAELRHAFETSTGALEGSISEFLVAALIYDQHDGPDDADGDPLGPATELVWRIFTEWLPHPDRPDFGPAGTDMADWMIGAQCLDPANATTLREFALASRQYRVAAPTPEVCAAVLSAAPADETPSAATSDEQSQAE